MTSEKSTSSRRLLLSNTSFTPARFIRGMAGETPQIISSPFLPRIDFIDCSPSTNRKPSATLLFPDPLGPTIAAMADVNASSVFFPNDLKPESSVDFKYTHLLYQRFATTPSLAAPSIQTLGA